MKILRILPIFCAFSYFKFVAPKKSRKISSNFCLGDKLGEI